MKARTISFITYEHDFFVQCRLQNTFDSNRRKESATTDMGHGGSRKVCFSLYFLCTSLGIFKSIVCSPWKSYRFRAITSSYYHGAHGAMVVFDVGNKDSYDHVQDWFRDIDRYCDPSIAKVSLVFSSQNLRPVKVKPVIPGVGGSYRLQTSATRGRAESCIDLRWQSRNSLFWGGVLWITRVIACWLSCEVCFRLFC